MRVSGGKAKNLARSVQFEGDRLVLIDQRALPFDFKLVECKSVEQVAAAIRNMTVRGAPAIGVAAAYGFVLGLRGALGGKKEMDARAQKVYKLLLEARPTAVNLRNAIARVMSACTHARSANEAGLAALEVAQRIDEENAVACMHIGMNGAELAHKDARILTICNTGPLACVEYGTAFAVIAGAHRLGKLKMAYACETRPRAQGSLTSWEMLQAGIPHRVIVDGAAGDLLRRRMVDFVVVGADRIACNGDFANKIGTYQLAVLAHENAIPFYVAAPMSTFDRELKNGAGIEVEERNEKEVLEFRGVRAYPQGARALNRAFDVTPGRYVRGFITEAGVIRK
ncbi:MAG: S-methyl-5-thioribose-1-phosphate isomerase [Candidatus Burarchaeum sp.]|nr:S-methyl-5-thioribose-1-phosphate isomerase [Candidatus Burarchaeum sp.]MDO8339769.1 S-methyl-5-thioribose-1-phosphate isomerase [Candidatus Burarchaeum sp.]